MVTAEVLMGGPTRIELRPLNAEARVGEVGVLRWNGKLDHRGRANTIASPLLVMVRVPILGAATVPVPSTVVLMSGPWR